MLVSEIAYGPQRRALGQTPRGPNVGTLYGREGGVLQESDEEQPEEREKSRMMVTLCLGEKVAMRADFTWPMPFLLGGMKVSTRVETRCTVGTPSKNRFMEK